MSSTPSNTTIGGAAPGAGNLVGGFAHFGIKIELGSTGTVIRGNTVGLRADASGAIPNEIGIERGRRHPRHPHRRDLAGARNVVGGNRIGVYAAGAGTRIEGNLVGLAPDGRTVGATNWASRSTGAAAACASATARRPARTSCPATPAGRGAEATPPARSSRGT